MNALLILTAAAHEGAAGAEHHMSMLDPANPEFWVYTGLTIFLLLAIFVAKAPQKIAETLDARIAETRRTLDEAQAVRAEAEALLAKAKAQSTAAASEVAAIIAHAESEAKVLLSEAEAHAADLVERRTKMADEKIAAAERAAIADVRAKAARAAASAAAALIAAHHDAGVDKPLVDSAIARLN